MIKYSGTFNGLSTKVERKELDRLEEEIIRLRKVRFALLKKILDRS